MMLFITANIGAFVSNLNAGLALNKKEKKIMHIIELRLHTHVLIFVCHINPYSFYTHTYKHIHTHTCVCMCVCISTEHIKNQMDNSFFCIVEG